MTDRRRILPQDDPEDRGSQARARKIFATSDSKYPANKAYDERYISFDMLNAKYCEL